MRGREILLNDTIGFIRDLPPDLIVAFRSTLEDSIESEVLLHVVDASDPWCEEKISIVDDTLDQIGAKQKRLYIFNKVDLLSSEEKENLEKKHSSLSPIFVSSFMAIGLENLKNILLEEI